MNKFFKPPFPLRARFCGNIELQCPNCGHVTRYRVNYITWRFRCKSSRCRRLFAFGLTLYDMSQLRHHGRPIMRPWDTIIPDCPILRYLPNGPVNRTVLVLQPTKPR